MRFKWFIDHLVNVKWADRKVLLFISLASLVVLFVGFWGVGMPAWRNCEGCNEDGRMIESPRTDQEVIWNLDRESTLHIIN